MTSASTVLAVDLGSWKPDDWSAAASVATTVLTLMAVVIALLAALYARQQVTLARQLREEQAQPFVVVDFEDNPAIRQGIDFVVENMGQTLAQNVKIVVDPPFSSTLDVHGFPLKDAPLMAQGIPSLPPRKRYTALFDTAPERQATDLPSKYTATVHFDDAHGRQQEPLTYILDLSVRRKLLSVSQYGLDDGVKTLREISKTMNELRSEMMRERQRQSAIERAGGESRSGDTSVPGTASDPT
ncbi:hypothetical protein ACFYX8_03985 [Streptomyces cyaneofuscatus]|uniref:hypothetical protein n=1 Tax=Streptomyces cyaneofuscatus TaxID=66883 RepID=UPI0036A97883